MNIAHTTTQAVHLDSVSVGMLDDKLAQTVDRLLTLGQEAREQMPNVDHFGPHLELGLDACRLRAIAKPSRIVEQYLRISHLDQQRWQSSQIRIERRGEGCAGILALQICL